MLKLAGMHWQTWKTFVDPPAMLRQIREVSRLQEFATFNNLVLTNTVRILCEKYLQHQLNLYHVFIDFKKAFYRVGHAAQWATMRKYNINVNLVSAIEHLYNTAISALQMNGSTGEWFRTTIGGWQGCLLSSTFFNIFHERIKSDALEEHDGIVAYIVGW